MKSCIINTPLGFTKITGDHNGIATIKVLDSQDSVSAESIPSELSECVNQLNEYFDDNRKEFDLKLNPKGTPFQKSVWKELLNIPHGKTLSYLKLSKRLGDVKAIRAVAAANGKNPLWIVVPCHRVIGSDGSLVGYAGGLSRKKWLLNHEQVHKQQALF